MDANQTRFYLILGRDDWGRVRLADGATPLSDVWSADHDRVSLPGPKPARDLKPWLDQESQELSLWPELAVVMPSKGDRPVDLSSRRGAARDRYGNWYVVSPSRGEILVRSVGSDAQTIFWPPPAVDAAAERGAFHDDRRDPGPKPGRCLFGGLVVTHDHHLVAISTAGAVEILVFDLFAGGPPLRLAWPAGIDLDVRDLAARTPGGFWLLDGVGPRLWEFNTYFQVVRPPWVVAAAPPAEHFAPAEGPGSGARQEPRGAEPGSACCLVSQITADHALSLRDHTVNPIAVEPLPGGGALVLDRGNDPGPRRFGHVIAYRDFRFSGLASLAEIARVIDTDESDADPERPWPGLVPHDFAVVVRPMDLVAPADGSHRARLHVAD